jgi:4-nitrophenyl phosphatase
MDGTLFRGPIPLAGLQRLFTFLQAKRISFVVVSNNTTKTASAYQEMLVGHGVQIQVDQILTAATATAAFLVDELGTGASLYVIGEPALCEVLRRAGFKLLQDAGQVVEAVVVGGDSTLTYDKLKYAALLLQRGARLVGTNPDLLCPTEEGLVPEAGTTLAALQAATGIAPTVIGKPSQPLFDLALRRLGSHRTETAILGDRLETDIKGGQQARLMTVLVTTGIDDEGTIRQKGIEPDLVVDGLDMLVDLWESAVTQKVAIQRDDREVMNEDP